MWGFGIGILVFELNLTPTQAHTEFYKHGCMIESRGTRENSFNGGVGEGGREGGREGGMVGFSHAAVAVVTDSIRILLLQPYCNLFEG